MTKRIFFERFDDPEREAMDNKREFTVGYQQLQEDSTGQTHCAYVYWRATPPDVIAALEQNPMLWAAVMAHWSMVVRREDAQPNTGDVEAIVAILSKCMVTRVGAREIAQEIVAYFAGRAQPPEVGDVTALADEMFAAYRDDFHGKIVAQGTMGVIRLLARVAASRFAAREAQPREALTRAKNDLQHIAAEASDGTLDTSATLESVLLAATAAVGEIDAALANPSTSAQRYAALEVAVDGIERFLKVATADPGATLGPIAANALAEARRRVDALRALDGGERG